MTGPIWAVAQGLLPRQIKVQEFPDRITEGAASVSHFSRMTFKNHLHLPRRMRSACRGIIMLLNMAILVCFIPLPLEERELTLPPAEVDIQGTYALRDRQRPGTRGLVVIVKRGEQYL